MNAIMLKILSLNESDACIPKLGISGEQVDSVDDFIESSNSKGLCLKAERNVLKRVEIRYSGFKD